MAKKRKLKKVVDESKTSTNEKPDFKPGDKPYYEYDGVILNANVAWDEVVLELQEAGKSVESIAAYAECDASIITNILEKKYDGLTFRAGARLLTMHCGAYPEDYSDF